MVGDPGWASWLVSRRGEIDRALPTRLGAAGPDPGSPESEALRRFRSYATSALRRNGGLAAPALDGLRVDAVRTVRLLEAWCEAACAVAGTEEAALRERLGPLAERFRSALLAHGAVRRARTAKPITRRAVPAAIDRIADAFLAVDLDTGIVVDANPAASALLGASRETLVGDEASRFVEAGERERWQTQLEGLVESSEARRFAVRLRCAFGQPARVDVCATRHAQRVRTLALLVMRAASETPGPLAG